MQVFQTLKVFKTSLDNFLRRTVATKVITTILSSILALNNQLFNCKNYLEIKGCFMGIIYAPAYANVCMDKFNHIFFIRTGNKSHPANNILNGLNTNRNSIKFAYKDFNQVLLFPHRSLWQKQQTIHKDFRKRSRQTCCLHIRDRTLSMQDRVGFLWGHEIFQAYIDGP